MHSLLPLENMNRQTTLRNTSLNTRTPKDYTFSGCASFASKASAVESAATE